MKTFSLNSVTLNSGYLYDKQELNRKTTIDAVYNRFFETGRISAFDFAYKPDDEVVPHVFWDSDVAKWMEGAVYVLSKNPDAELESRVDALVDKIAEHQCEDGYFNIHYTVVKPEERWGHRSMHELYCAGHLIEAAVAYAELLGKTKMLDCMEKYVDHIYRVFVEEKSAAFSTPGHEEIELALMRLYRLTKKRKYLELCAFFVNTRGTLTEHEQSGTYTQSHLPVREQTEAVGHAVRALYLYTGMASLARELGDKELINACKTLWKDVTERKMYVTGSAGSTCNGESFTVAYDLPNDWAYAETCASIALVLFAQEMLKLEGGAEYADVIERAFYNGILSSLSLSGDAFFYENSLEINRLERRADPKRRFAISQRVECFACSCCPPNINRTLSSIGQYIYGFDGDTLFVNQFISSTLSEGELTCEQVTDYPRNGAVKLTVGGAAKVAVRIPAWCQSFKTSKPYTEKDGYAVFDNDGSAVELEFCIEPVLVWADPRVIRDAGKVCVMRGPVVYCGEGVDNGEDALHSFVLTSPISARCSEHEQFGLPTIELDCLKKLPFEGCLYSQSAPKTEPATLKLIPYNCFANRGKTDMLIWFHTN